MSKKIEIDPTQIEKLASIHCTIAEIAMVFGCSRDTIENNYRDALDRGKAQGKARLRRLQWKAAEKGNVAMLIFLGKQILGQADAVSVDDRDKDSKSVRITPGEYLAILKARQDKEANG